MHVCRLYYYAASLSIKALLHGAIFHATCLAMALRDKLHEALHRVEVGSTLYNDCTNYFYHCSV
jgi:hypothetical protein